MKILSPVFISAINFLYGNAQFISWKIFDHMSYENHLKEYTDVFTLISLIMNGKTCINDKYK